MAESIEMDEESKILDNVPVNHKSYESQIPLSATRLIRSGNGHEKVVGEDAIGKHIQLRGETDTDGSEVWYSATIREYHPERQTHLVEFQDGKRDYYVLSKHQIRLTENKQGDSLTTKVTSEPIDVEQARRHSISRRLSVDTDLANLKISRKASVVDEQQTAKPKVNETNNYHTPSTKSETPKTQRKREQPTQLMIKAKLFQPMLKTLLIERIKLGPNGYETLKQKGFPRLSEPLVLVQRGLDSNAPKPSISDVVGKTQQSATGSNAALIEQMRKQFLAIQQQMQEKDDVDNDEDDELLSSPTKTSAPPLSESPTQAMRLSASSRIAALRKTFGAHSHTSASSGMAQAASEAVARLRRSSITTAMTSVPEEVSEFKRKESNRRASIADPIKIATSGPVASNTGNPWLTSHISHAISRSLQTGLKDDVNAKEIGSGTNTADILEARRASIGGLGSSTGGISTGDLDVVFELPPSPKPHENLVRIADIRTSINETSDGMNHINDLSESVKSKEIVVGAISPRELERHKKLVEDSFKQQQEERREAFRKRQEELKQREIRARHRVLQVADSKRKEVVEQEQVLRSSIKERESYLRRLFQRKLDLMRSNLLRQEALVRENFGELRRGMTGLYGATKSVSMNWMKQPQPMRFRIDLLRALKDKVPRGRYVLLVTLYDRLGGVPVQFSNMSVETRRRKELPPATNPSYHSGRFDDAELVVGQHIFCLCPSQVELRPSMVYVFELFLLGSERRQQADQVVAWTVLPASDKHLQYTRGKFRLPMMVGKLDRKCDKHMRMLNRYGRNLNVWLCNIYLEAEPLPREYVNRLDGTVKTEFEMSRDCTRKLLQTTDLASHDPDAESLTSNTSSVVNNRATRFNMRRIIFARKPKDKSEDMEKEENRIVSGSSSSALHHPSNHGLRQRQKPISANRQYFKNLPVERAPVLRDAEHIDPNASESEVMDDEYQYAIERSLSSKVPGTRERLRFIFHEIRTDFSKTSFFSSEIWTTLLIVALAFWLRVYVHYLGQYLYLMNGNGAVYSFEFMAHRVVLKYSWQTMPPYKEIMVVLAGPFSNTVLMCLFCTCAYLSITILGALPDTFSRWTAAFGVATVLDPLLTFIVDVLSTNIDCLSIPVCVDDPFSSSCWCSEGDSSKLYYRFLHEQGSGFIGMVLIAIIYTSCVCLNTVILYMYMSNLYMNGRVLDLHRRLHLRDGAFFVPHDFEVSPQELEYICHRARRWRGPRGDHREIHVTERTETDPNKPSQKIVTADIQIYTIRPAHADNSQSNLQTSQRNIPEQSTEPESVELWRRFFKQHDGSIIEIFDKPSTSMSKTGKHGPLIPIESQHNNNQDVAIPIQLDNVSESPQEQRIGTQHPRTPVDLEIVNPP